MKQKQKQPHAPVTALVGFYDNKPGIAYAYSVQEADKFATMTFDTKSECADFLGWKLGEGVIFVILVRESTLLHREVMEHFKTCDGSC